MNRLDSRARRDGGMNALLRAVGTLLVAIAGGEDEGPQPADEPEAPPARFRFSVFDMLVVTFAISVGLAGGKWMPAGVFALLMGVVTVGGLIIVELYPPQSRAGWLAWVAIVLAYLSAWASALASAS